MTGNVVDEATITTDAGTYDLALRFVEWEIPEHRDTQGYAVPRYSLQVTNPHGDSASFVGHGSINEAIEQELTNTNAVQWAETHATDALSFYHDADGTHADLDRRLTAEAIKGDFADMIDNLACERGIEAPSHAVRALGALMATASDFYALGLNYEELMNFYHAVREVLDE